MKRHEMDLDEDEGIAALWKLTPAQRADDLEVVRTLYALVIGLMVAAGAHVSDPQPPGG